MDPAAVEKAEARLRKATTAVTAVEEARSYTGFSDAWSDLLIALNAIYAALQQGAKGRHKSEKWMADKLAERRADKLLQYLHQARNADEHGIRPITAIEAGQITLAAKEGSGGIYIRSLLVTPKSVKVEYQPVHPGAEPDVKVEPARARLVAVRNRGIDYQPPTHHLGQSLEDDSPLAAARAGLKFHEGLVAAAKALQDRAPVR